MITPRRHSAFRLAAFRAIERATAALGGRRFYRSRYLAEDRLVVRHERIVLPRPIGRGMRTHGAGSGPLPLASPSDRPLLRIVQVSDVHGGAFVGPGDLAGVRAHVERLAPDVLAVTGDFVANDLDDFPRVADDLAALTAPLGVFAVFGNHDYKDRREPEIVRALPGWRFLRNDATLVETPAGLRVAVAGIEDIEEGRPADVERALARAPKDVDLGLALSHGPEAAPAFAKAGFDLVLSGHSHGTQVDLPFLRTLGPAHPGLRIPLGRATLLLSRGLGPIGVPLRVGAPAELVCVDITAPMSQDRGPCKEASDSTPASSTSGATP